MESETQEQSRAAQEQSRAGQRVTWVGFGANALLVVVKAAAGILGHSQALIADAIHSVSDFVTDAVVLWGLKVGRQAPDEDHPFGHARFETVASAGVGVALVAVAVGLGFDAGSNIVAGEVSHPGPLALAGAMLSILVKEALYHYTIRVGRRIRSPAVVANAWHHRSDAFSSVAVVLGVGAAIVKPEWGILDAFAALLVSVFILRVGLQILIDAIRELADTAPEPAVIEKLDVAAKGVEGVLDTPDHKVRSIGGVFHVQIHVEVPRTLTVVEGHDLALAVDERITAADERVADVLVHVDPENEP